MTAMRVYPPPPSTAPSADRCWVLLCDACGARETYPDIFARSAVRHIVEQLALSHVCGESDDWAEDWHLVPPSTHPGYAGYVIPAPVNTVTLAEHLMWMHNQ